MTELLTKAMAEISKLPQQDQDAFAAWILDEIRAEHRWTRAFEGSQDTLAKLADEALQEHRNGKTTPLDPDRL